jgi:hypothetical protein
VLRGAHGKTTRLEGPPAHDRRGASDLETSPELPQGRTTPALELLGDSVALADHLLTIEPAAVLGKLGGKATAKRGLSISASLPLCARRKPGAGRANQPNEPRTPFLSE